MTHSVDPELINTNTIDSLFRRLRARSVHMVANAGNAGDGLIMYATNKLLNRYGVKPCYISSDDIVSGSIVLFGGGGNLIEGLYDTMANSIRRNLENNLCVVLPHTISGYADIFSSAGPRLQVFARESRSLQNLLDCGAPMPFVHLAEDMAFYLSRDDLPGSRREPSLVKLSCFRTDGEAVSSVVPAWNYDLSRSWEGSWWQNPEMCELSTATLVAALSQYQFIATDRLHICILAAILGRKVLFGGNSYYKNREVFDHSIKVRFSNVTYYESREELFGDFDQI